MSTTLGRSVVATTTRRGDAARARAKKKRSGGGRSGNDDYAQDFALYGSFDESYTEGAGLLLGKGELRSSGTRRGAKGRSGAGYDAVAGVLDALAEVKSERKSRGGGGRRYDAYGDDDEDAADEGAAADGTAAGRAKTLTRNPRRRRRLDRCGRRPRWRRDRCRRNRKRRDRNRRLW